ncbi:MAG: PIN domain-containing protein [Desulfobacteraceae bacterium]|nr:PIN domain-containing protein [Desulfobacteraceae bacterium]MBC2756463.1 PIN domain-containing protein [Desulfobacteraceae bacterium]MBC2763593.1 PIN domain-containing protein [ANME-2 cluster archaeon]
MSVLVDTSIWIEYFRSGNNSEKLDFLIDENLIVINDLILAELVPSLKVRNQRKIVKLLKNIKRLRLLINWDQIIDFQFKCLENGLNGIGIPDLILAQNAKQNRCEIYSLDTHFKLMKDILELQLLV